MKTIAKFSLFVIFLSGAAVVSSCTKAISNEPGGADSGPPLYQSPVVLGNIGSDDVTESSGIAASKCQPGVFWTHNDSGDEANIYAFNEKGENLGTFRVTGARNDDWEDIAEYRDQGGRCFIYIADTGDNKMRRPERTIYRVPEPSIGDAARNTGSGNAIPTEAAAVLNFHYPGTQRNAEVLMVNPQDGSIYVLTKSIEHESEVFKLAGIFGSATPVEAQKVADVAVPNVPNGQLTGGDISPDGKRAVLCDYTWGYELELPRSAKAFDEIWAAKPKRFDLGRLPQTEAVGYTADGEAVIATSEKAHSPIMLARRRK